MPSRRSNQQRRRPQADEDARSGSGAQQWQQALVLDDAQQQPPEVDPLREVHARHHHPSLDSAGDHVQSQQTGHPNSSVAQQMTYRPASHNHPAQAQTAAHYQNNQASRGARPGLPAYNNQTNSGSSRTEASGEQAPWDALRLVSPSGNWNQRTAATSPGQYSTAYQTVGGQRMAYVSRAGVQARRPDGPSHENDSESSDEE